jgi:hypothetical protein
MPTFRIPLAWWMTGTAYVEADTLEEAEEKALDGSLPSPGCSSYIPDSIELDRDAAEYGAIVDDEELAKTE